jgi:hypothetical protein
MCEINMTAYIPAIMTCTIKAALYDSGWVNIKIKPTTKAVMKYAEDMEYSGKPRTAVFVDLLIKNGVIRSIMYAKWINPYEIHTDAG